MQRDHERLLDLAHALAHQTGRDGKRVVDWAAGQRVRLGPAGVAAAQARLQRARTQWRTHGTLPAGFPPQLPARGAVRLFAASEEEDWLKSRL